MIYRFLSLCTDGACKKAKETSVIGEFVQSFMPPLCKGRGTTKWWKGCKKTIPQSACADSSLYTREPEKLCTHSPITEVSFAFLQAPSVQRLKNLYIIPDY